MGFHMATVWTLFENISTWHLVQRGSGKWQRRPHWLGNPIRRLWWGSAWNSSGLLTAHRPLACSWKLPLCGHHMMCPPPWLVLSTRIGSLASQSILLLWAWKLQSWSSSLAWSPARTSKLVCGAPAGQQFWGETKSIKSNTPKSNILTELTYCGKGLTTGVLELVNQLWSCFCTLLFCPQKLTQGGGEI